MPKVTAFPPDRRPSKTIKIKQTWEPKPHSKFEVAREAVMKKCLVLLVVLVFAVSAALAAAPKTYQVTGPVLSVTDDMIVVQKGKEKWEIARTKDTQVKGDLKVGAKVTIQYRMMATDVEVKAPAKEAKPKETKKK